MADWTPLPNTSVGVGGLPSGTTVTALRDNPVAIAEGAPGAPRVETPAIQDSAVTTAKIANAAVTTAKIANANVTTAKLPVGTRSFSGALNAGISVLVSYSDNFAFVPRVGGSNIDTVMHSGSFRVINTSNNSRNYSITWRYLTT